MAVNLQTIRNAIRDRLQDVVGLNTYSYDTVSTVYPRAIVMPRTNTTAEYHSTFGPALTVINLDIEVKTCATDPVSAQMALDQYVGSGTGMSGTSVPDALEQVSTGSTTPTLGGAVENIVVESVVMTPGVQLTSGEYEFTATFTVAVLARRD